MPTRPTQSPLLVCRRVSQRPRLGAGVTAVDQDAKSQGRPLRVLHVSASVARSDGGPSVAMLGLHRQLLAEGLHSLVLATDADGRATVPDSESWELQATPNQCIQLYPMHVPRRLKASIGLGRALAQHIPAADLVHIQGTYLFHSAVAARVAHKYRVPYVLQPDGSLESYQRRQSAVVKRAYDTIERGFLIRNAAAVLFATDSEATAAADIIAPEQARVVPLAAHLDPPSDQSLPWLEALLDRPLILFLGRIAPKKRLDLLIGAMPLVLKKFPEAALVIAGAGDNVLEGALRNEVTKHALTRSVMFVGRIDGGAKTRLLQAASVFALPSENENFAVAVAEALQASVPVVLSDQVALAPLVEANRAGVVLHVLSTSELAEALVNVLGLDPPARAATKEGAHRAGSTLSWQATSQAFQRVVVEFACSPSTSARTFTASNSRLPG